MNKRLVLNFALSASLAFSVVINSPLSTQAESSNLSNPTGAVGANNFDPASLSDSHSGAVAAARTGMDMAAILPAFLPVPHPVPMPLPVPVFVPRPVPHAVVPSPVLIPQVVAPTRTMPLNGWGNEIKKNKVKKGKSDAKEKSNKPEEKFVALTFDDGPSPVYTPMILAILKREGIHATFCVIGREAKRYPEMVKQIVAEGHKIADHSMNHDEHLDQRSDKKMETEIIGTRDLIQSIVPGTPVEFYRAPAGNMNAHQRQLIRSWGLKPLGWSVDTKDWQKPGVDQIMATVKQQLHPGCLILMHDSGGNRSETVEALEKVIPLLKKDGYQFVFPG